MKREDVKLIHLPNDELARKLVEIDYAMEAETGQSILGKSRPFLESVLADTEDSTIPGAFGAVLNQRLTGKLRSANLK